MEIATDFGTVRGQYLETPTASRPDIHRLFWTSTSFRFVGTLPRNGGLDDG